jgi:ankyrin repeat protein
MEQPERGSRIFTRLAMLLLAWLCLASPLRAAGDAALDEVERLIRLRSYAAAIERLRPLAEDGVAAAQYRLAGLYRNGKGTDRNLEKAIDLYLDAAQAGHAGAQYALASIIEKSADTPAARNDAYYWYRQAAAQDNRQALLKLEQLRQAPEPDRRQIDDSDIFTAIRQDQQALIKSMIAQEVDLDLTDRHGNSAVLAALLAEAPQLAAILIEHTDNFQRPNAIGIWPLHVAAARGYREIVIELAYRDASLDQADAQGNTALMLALKNRRTEIAALLLELGARHDIVNLKGQTAVELAYAADNPQGRALFAGLGIEPVASKAARPADPVATLKAGVARQGERYAGWPLLNIAIELGEEASIKQLLAGQADAGARDPDGNNALHVAARSADAANLRRVLDAGAEVNAVNRKRETALYLAAEAACLACVRLLLERGADPSIANRLEVTPLEVAVQKSHAKIAHALLQPKIRYTGIHRVLLLAVDKRLESLTMRLIGLDPQLASLDDMGRSVLWHCADQGLARAVSALIDSGAFHLDRADSAGYTPLAQAAYRGHFDTARVLIQRGASTAALTRQNNSLLMLASQSGNTRLVAELLARGVQINDQNDSGETALMIAAARGHGQTVELLIASGANLQLRNREQLSAYQIALNSGHQQVAETIRDNTNALLRIFD